METLMAAELPQQKSGGGLARRLSRLLRRKRSVAGGGGEYDESSIDSSINSVSKLKLSAATLDMLFRNAAAEKTNSPATEKTNPEKEKDKTDSTGAHAFVASLFAGVSAVKAAYAQLQQAQRPYDAEGIQSADAAMVAELTKLSEQKRLYARDPLAAVANCVSAAAELAAHADEQRHLVRTYEITAGKLATELRARDAEAERARAALAEELRVHLSGLDATHFLAASRRAARAVRAFARTMVREMRRTGWDPSAAAAAVHPGVALRHGDAAFAVESFVALKVFDGFHRKDFGISSLRDRRSYDRRRFFDEFNAAASPAFGEFLRERYMSVVHERIESAFFGSAAQRDAVASGGEPGTPWLAEFAEMARRVWRLHCLFFSFEDGEASVFQVHAGARFSEVYMESVADDDGGGGVVGFTVVPGFNVGRTVVQCRVYLTRPAPRQP
uniref:Uncharacterized protein n=1 Tax=Leersia perrieri TaxID=77586 RepID=A0A0D9WDS7_9ORYZ